MAMLSVIFLSILRVQNFSSLRGGRATQLFIFQLLIISITLSTISIKLWSYVLTDSILLYRTSSSAIYPLHTNTFVMKSFLSIVSNIWLFLQNYFSSFVRRMLQQRCLVQKSLWTYSVLTPNLKLFQGHLLSVTEGSVSIHNYWLQLSMRRRKMAVRPLIQSSQTS